MSLPSVSDNKFVVYHQDINNWEYNSEKEAKSPFSSRNKLSIDVLDDGNIVITKIAQSGFQHFISTITGKNDRFLTIKKEVLNLSDDVKKKFEKEVGDIKRYPNLYRVESNLVDQILKDMTIPKIDDKIVNLKSGLININSSESSKAKELSEKTTETVQKTLPIKHQSQSPLVMPVKQHKKISEFVQTSSELSKTSQTEKPVIPPSTVTESENDLRRKKEIEDRQLIQQAKLKEIEEKHKFLEQQTQQPPQLSKQQEKPTVSQDKAQEMSQALVVKDKRLEFSLKKVKLIPNEQVFNLIKNYHEAMEKLSPVFPRSGGLNDALIVRDQRQEVSPTSPAQQKVKRVPKEKVLEVLNEYLDRLEGLQLILSKKMSNTDPKYSTLVSNILDLRHIEINAIIKQCQASDEPITYNQYSSLIGEIQQVDIKLASTLKQHQSIEQLFQSAVKELDDIYQQLPLTTRSKPLMELNPSEFYQTRESLLKMDVSQWTEKQVLILNDFFTQDAVIQLLTEAFTLSESTMPSEIAASDIKAIKDTEKVEEDFRGRSRERRSEISRSREEVSIGNRGQLEERETRTLKEIKQEQHTVLKNYKENFEQLSQKLLAPSQENSINTDIASGIINQRREELNALLEEFETSQHLMLPEEMGELILTHQLIDNGLIKELEKNRNQDLGQLLNDTYQDLQNTFDGIPWAEENRGEIDLKLLTSKELQNTIDQIREIDTTNWDPESAQALGKFLIQADITTRIKEGAENTVRDKNVEFWLVYDDFSSSELPAIVELFDQNLEHFSNPAVSNETPIEDLISTLSNWIEDKNALEGAMDNVTTLMNPRIASYVETYAEAQDLQNENTPYFPPKTLDYFVMELPKFDDLFESSKVKKWANQIQMRENDLKLLINSSNKAGELQADIELLVNPTLTKTLEEQSNKRRELKALYPNASFKGIKNAIYETEIQLKAIRDSRKTHGWFGTESKPLSSLSIEELEDHKNFVGKEVEQQEFSLAKDRFGLQEAIDNTQEFNLACDLVNKEIEEYLKKPETVPLAYSLRMTMQREQKDLETHAERMDSAKSLHGLAESAKKSKQTLIKRSVEIESDVKEIEFLKQLEKVPPESSEAIKIKQFFIGNIRQKITNFQDEEMAPALQSFVTKAGLPVNNAEMRALITKNNQALEPFLGENELTVTEGTVPGLRSTIQKPLDQLSGPQLIAFQDEVVKEIQKSRNAVELLTSSYKKADTAQQKYQEVVGQANAKIEELMKKDPPQYMHAAPLQQAVNQTKRAYDKLMAKKDGVLKTAQDFEEFYVLVGQFNEHIIGANKNVPKGDLNKLQQMKEAEKSNLKINITINGEKRDLLDYLKNEALDHIRRPILDTQYANNDNLLSLLAQPGMNELPQQWIKNEVYQTNTNLNELGLTFTYETYDPVSGMVSNEVTKAVKAETLTADEIELWGNTALMEIEKGKHVIEDLHLAPVSKAISAYDTRLKEVKDRAAKLRENDQLVAAQFLEQTLAGLESQRKAAIGKIASSQDMVKFEATLKKSIEELNQAEKHIPELELEDQLFKLKEGTKDYQDILKKLVNKQRSKIDTYTKGMEQMHQHVMNSPLLSQKWKDEVGRAIIQQMNLPVNAFSEKFENLSLSPKEFRAFRQTVDSSIREKENAIHEMIPLAEVESSVQLFKSAEDRALKEIIVLQKGGNFALAADLSVALKSQTEIFNQAPSVLNNTDEMRQFSDIAEKAKNNLNEASFDCQVKRELQETLLSKVLSKSYLEQMQYLERKYPNTFKQLPDYQTLHKQQLDSLIALNQNTNTGVNIFLFPYQEIQLHPTNVQEWIDQVKLLQVEIQKLQLEFVPPARFGGLVSSKPMALIDLTHSQLIQYESKLKELDKKLQELYETRPEIVKFDLILNKAPADINQNEIDLLEEQLHKLKKGTPVYKPFLKKLIEIENHLIKETVEELKVIKGKVAINPSTAPEMYTMTWRDKMKDAITSQEVAILLKTESVADRDLKMSPKEYRQFSESVENLIDQGNSKIQEMIPLEQVELSISAFESTQKLVQYKLKALRFAGKFDLAADLETALNTQVKMYSEAKKHIDNTDDMHHFSEVADTASSKLKEDLEDIKKRESRQKEAPLPLQKMQYLEKTYPDNYDQLADYQAIRKKQLESISKLKEISSELHTYVTSYQLAGVQPSSVSEWLKMAEILDQQISQLQSGFVPSKLKGVELTQYITQAQGNMLKAQKLLDSRPEI